LAAGRQDGSAAHLNLPLSRLAETESDNVTRSLELETSADAEVFPFSFGSAAHLNLPLFRLAETESDNVTRSLELETSAKPYAKCWNLSLMDRIRW